MVVRDSGFNNAVVQNLRNEVTVAFVGQLIFLALGVRSYLTLAVAWREFLRTCTRLLVIKETESSANVALFPMSGLTLAGRSYLTHLVLAKNRSRVSLSF